MGGNSLCTYKAHAGQCFPCKTGKNILVSNHRRCIRPSAHWRSRGTCRSSRLWHYFPVHRRRKLSAVPRTHKSFAVSVVGYRCGGKAFRASKQDDKALCTGIVFTDAACTARHVPTCCAFTGDSCCDPPSQVPFLHGLFIPHFWDEVERPRDCKCLGKTPIVVVPVHIAAEDSTNVVDLR